MVEFGWDDDAEVQLKSMDNYNTRVTPCPLLRPRRRQAPELAIDEYVIFLCE